MELEESDAFCWEYLGEGNLNIVVRYRGTDDVYVSHLVSFFLAQKCINMVFLSFLERKSPENSKER
jgi:hypothetical protein